MAREEGGWGEEGQRGYGTEERACIRDYRGVREVPDRDNSASVGEITVKLEGGRLLFCPHFCLPRPADKCCLIKDITLCLPKAVTCANRGAKTLCTL
jgi:hypothetical protein